MERQRQGGREREAPTKRDIRIEEARGLSIEDRPGGACRERRIGERSEKGICLLILEGFC